ncbi:asparagine synthase (glutamine-hydrolyzing) [Vibrio crassostreae]|nr:asparagine synthase (glutamine-hydrolyzing) [Vibrio crassostreae]
MCGIAGVVESGKINRQKFQESLLKMNHRGPDGFGIEVDNNVCIGHNRLSILDLSESGSQPMKTPCGSVVIAVNGEIYNYKDLKIKLENKYTFKSESDSEVILWGYIEWGMEKLLELIDGMYSISIYDRNKKVVYLARDRAGIKPLFYYYNNGTFIWASEIKFIREYVNELNVDNSALYDFLTYTYIPHPKTLYEEVKKLPQASLLTYDINKSGLLVSKYWELDRNALFDGTYEEAVERAEYFLTSSVSQQLVSDVPLGVFLSGGVDSTLITSLARQNQNIDELSTFTIEFKGTSQDESNYAKWASEIIGTKHHSKEVYSGDIDHLLEVVDEWYDEPFHDTSSFPTYEVSKFASMKAKVLLGGDGADELFGGYNWYQRNNRFRMKQDKLLSLYQSFFGINSSICKKINRRVIGKYLSDDLTHLSMIHGSPMPYEKKLIKSKLGLDSKYDDLWAFRRYEKFYGTNLRKNMQYIDFNMFMVDDVLAKVDRTSMQNSIEVRVPFLSRELIEFAFSLPESYLYKNGLKSILKSILRKDFPVDFIERKKQGFSIPINDWNKVEFQSGYPHEANLKRWLSSHAKINSL